MIVNSNDVLFKIFEFGNSNSDRIPGYFVVSTAPENVEDDLYITEEITALNETAIDSIVDKIYSSTEEIPKEIVILIHGYNSPQVSVKNWYEETHKYINQKINKDKKFVFIGYRWSSETFMPPKGGNLFSRIRDVFAALPLPLLFILILGIIGSAISIFFSKIFLLWLFQILVFVVLSLVLLRASVYFRDSYRANNFAVPDLVELLRQLDKKVFEKATIRGSIAQYETGRRIKVNFICHSMGAFVTTNVIRILSDVFDPSSIGTISINDPNKLPSSEIGRVFSLGRLILVSPDIPVDTIISGRANFLRSSLRRFEEAYLFSNEGDLALRIASTAANYFIFPARTRIRGYRLGNVTVSSDKNYSRPRYGIVNLSTLPEMINNQIKYLSDYLDINILSKDTKLSDINIDKSEEGEPVANLFTYFDCTDYKDYKKNDPKRIKTRIVSWSLNQPAFVRFFVYLGLFVAWSTNKIDVHGGYFEGKFSSDTIYKIAFLSFGGFLDSLYEENQDIVNREGNKLQEKVECDRVISTLREKDRSNPLRAKNPFTAVERRLIALALLAKECEDKTIQTLLSPERYKVDILLSSSRVECKADMLQAETKG